MNTEIEAGQLLVVTRSHDDTTAPAPFFMNLRDVGRGTVRTFISADEHVVALESQMMLKMSYKVVKVLSTRGVGWVYVKDVA